MCAATVVVALALTGCTSAAAPAPTTAPSTVAPSETPPTASAPALLPEGTAADNEPVFVAALQQVWAGEGRQSSAAYVAALETAGFARADLQVTPDRTSVGEMPDSIQVSARWAGECLVGHIAVAQPEPVVAVMPLLAGGACLVGATVPLG